MIEDYDGVSMASLPGGLKQNSSSRVRHIYCYSPSTNNEKSEYPSYIQLNQSMVSGLDSVSMCSLPVVELNYEDEGIGYQVDADQDSLNY